MSAANSAGAGPGARREPPGELRSAELVSRLLAATPPYLYNLPLAPHSYFFSEMLRSLVHAKNGGDRGAPTHAPHRRARKRAWGHGKPSPPPEAAVPRDWPPRADWAARPLTTDKYELQADPGFPLEKPLELTMSKSSAPKSAGAGYKGAESAFKSDESLEDTEGQIKMRKSPKASDGSERLKEDKYSQGAPPAASPPTLALPPPPPLWYPSLYPPPYGIDPLNFFIDLRVSGHIYDRKVQGKEAPPAALPGLQREAAAPGAGVAPQLGPLGFDNNNSSAFKDSVKSSRHVSAFSVPKPRDSGGKHFPMNLCHGAGNKFNMKYFADVDSKAHDGQAEKNPTSTHYVMHNLKRIYGELADGPRGEAEREVTAEAEDPEGARDSDPEAERKRCKDLRALIGLELVVDYVKGRAPPDGDSSSDVEVLGEQKAD